MLSAMRLDVWLRSSLLVSASLFSGCRREGGVSPLEVEPSIAQAQAEEQRNQDVELRDLPRDNYALTLERSWATIKANPQAFGPSGEGLLNRLEALFLQEFNDPRPTQPEALVEGIVKCLIDHGLSTPEVRSTAWAFAHSGAFSFADQLRAEARLKHLLSEGVHDDDRTFCEGGQKVGATPHGVLYLSTLGSRDPFGMDLTSLGHVAKERGVFVVQADQTVAPVVLMYLWSGRTGSVPRTLSVTGRIEVVSQTDPTRVVFTRDLSTEYRVTTEPDGAGIFEIPVLVMLSDLKDGEDSLVGRVKYKVTEQQDGAKEELSSFDGEYHLFLKAYQGPGSSKGFGIAECSVDGPIPVPGLLHEIFQSFVRSSLMYSKDFFRQSQLAEKHLQDVQSGLIGKELRRVEMAYHPDKKGPSTLNLPTSGRVVIVLGASWCGPCKNLDPLVQDYREFLRRAGLPDAVLKMSIQDDEALKELVVDPHFNEQFPDGVLLSAQSEQLGAGAIPRYYEIRDGKIIGQGTLDSSILKRWKAEAEARLQN